MPAISVILPIYNAEPYLRQCLDSVAQQTLRDIEVICVNDGSSDESLSILREYEAKDPRFVILDKQNGGYGHSLNYGLERACGEYLSIIEPDDFINPKMYEHLFTAAHSVGSCCADVVKGSYYEYFDGNGEMGPAFKIPNLTRCMPKEPFEFSLTDNCEVFCHHPSIWSALYRREFLKEEGIRFVEPKGAGWADNPFLVETLVKASSIVWVPKAYYYYRQTNAGASSFLKDYRIPFDRLREMRSILASDSRVNEDILAAFYLREFDYIRSVIGEFGFKESDPCILGLIREALESMDENIVRSHWRIRSEDIRYYLEFLGKSTVAPRERFEANASPLISFLVPVRNDASCLVRSLSSIAEFSKGSFEVICFDCGSSDRSIQICEEYAATDARFSVLDGIFGSVSSGVVEAGMRALGQYAFVFDPRYALTSNAVLEAACDADAAGGLDVVIFDDSGRFCADVAFLTHTSFSSGEVGLGLHDGCRVSPNRTYLPFTPEDASDFLFNMGDLSLRSKLFRTGHLRRLADGVAEEGMGGAVLSAELLATAGNLGYKVINCLEQLKQPSIETPFKLEIGDEVADEEEVLLPSALLVLAKHGDDSPYRKTCLSLVLDAYMSDLSTRRSPEALLSYYESNHCQVKELIAVDAGEGYLLHSVDAYNDYQVLDRFGLSEYVALCLKREEREGMALRKELGDILKSRTFKAGEKITDLAKKMLPTALVGRVRGTIASGS